MTATAEPDDAAPLTGEEDKPDFLGHPRGLWFLAFTEAAFDSFRKLYGGLNGRALASAIFGTYTASVYLTPIFGGFLADRLLGRRRTVLLGAFTMAAAPVSVSSSSNSSPAII